MEQEEQRGCGSHGGLSEHQRERQEWLNHPPSPPNQPWTLQCPAQRVCAPPQMPKRAAECRVLERGQASPISSMLCDDLEGWDGEGGREAQEGGDMGMYVHIELIHFVVQQKLTQHCKAIILQ